MKKKIPTYYHAPNSRVHFKTSFKSAIFKMKAVLGESTRAHLYCGEFGRNQSQRTTWRIPTLTRSVTIGVCLALTNFFSQKWAFSSSCIILVLLHLF